MKRLAAKSLILVLLVFTLLSPVVAAEKVLYLPLASSLDNLDPRILTSTAHQLVQFAIFESLVRTHQNDVLPGMAERWEVSEDGKVYTFYLRDAKWSDGKPVTADDFVHAFVRMFEICPASPIYDDILNGAQLRAGEVPPEELGVKALDEKTVQITLRNPVPYFLSLIGHSFGSPGRADLVEKFGEGYGASAESLASNGPFVLKEWKHEDMIVIEKNPDYWNADAIKLDKVVFYVIPNHDTRRNMFDNGELDWFVPATTSEVEWYRSQGLLHEYARGGVSYLQLNRYGQNDPIKAKILSNPNFVKAISYAIDRQGYIDSVLQGNALPATAMVPPATGIYPGKTWGDVSPNFGKFHPETADLAKSQEYMQKVLDDLGFRSVDEFPEFDLLTSADPTDPKEITSYILSVLMDMGLKVNVRIATGKQFWDSIYEPALEYDFARLGWGPDYDDPHTYMGYWVTESTDMGVTYDNAEYDALLDKANKEVDLVKRAEILAEAEALFLDTAPAVPLLWNKGTIAIQPWVKGVTFALSGLTTDYIYADIEK